VSTRAGIVVTGTEVLTGRIADRNGPWVSEQLLGLGVDVAHITVCGDRPDDLTAQLRFLVDEGVDLIVTTGGTGPALRDVTPEGTLDVADREMPGFGEQMRQISLHFVPTAILSRQVAVIRKQALIINLPGQPKAIAETLAGHPAASGIFAAVPYCIDLLQGPYLETNDEVCKAFRPKSAQRPAP
jgi:molybdopterin adenylyltransferase